MGARIYHLVPGQRYEPNMAAIAEVIWPCKDDPPALLEVAKVALRHADLEAESHADRQCTIDAVAITLLACAALLGVTVNDPDDAYMTAPTPA